MLLGGPVIGFDFQGSKKSNISIIVGDRCRPKYFGARKLSLQVGEKRQVQLYWQTTHIDYISKCLSKGLSYIQNPELLEWVSITRNKITAIFDPIAANIYAQNSFLRITYGGETKELKLQMFLLYNRPTPATHGDYRLITANFTTLSDAWVSSRSKFEFSDNYYSEGWRSNGN